MGVDVILIASSGEEREKRRGEQKGGRASDEEREWNIFIKWFDSQRSSGVTSSVMGIRMTRSEGNMEMKQFTDSSSISEEGSSKKTIGLTQWHANTDCTRGWCTASAPSRKRITAKVPFWWRDWNQYKWKGGSCWRLEGNEKCPASWHSEQLKSWQHMQQSERRWSESASDSHREGRLLQNGQRCVRDGRLTPRGSELVWAQHSTSTTTKSYSW